jgi:phenylalanyl-tRNA synthetase alpha chain
MTMEPTDLPQRIVELLSKPNLTALPENPVGAIWEAFREHFAGFEEVELPEKIEADRVRQVLGEAPGADLEADLEAYLTAVGRQEGLRTELTVPMLVDAASTPAGPPRRIARGKTYRLGDDEDRTRLHAFHQAEVLWIEEGLSEWRIMGPFTEFVEGLSGGARLRIEQVDYSLYCERGWQVSAQWPGQEWASLAGWGRMKKAVVDRLGYDSSRFTAVGLGFGLERVAMLRYGIDDIRKVAAERLPAA